MSKSQMGLATLTAAAATLLVSVSFATTTTTTTEPAKKPASVAPAKAPAAAPIADGGAAMKAGSSTVSAETELVEATKSPWSPSLQLYNYRDFKVTDALADDDNVLGNRLYLNLGYKLSETLSIQASQRFVYDMKKDNASARQEKTIKDLDLRINILQTGLKGLGADAAVFYRIAPATTAGSRIDRKMVSYFLVNPSFTWKQTPSAEISWDIAYQTIAYSAGKGATGVDYGSAFNRQNHALGQSGTYSYGVTEKLSVYQSLGHTMALHNSSKGAAPQPGLSLHGHWADIETGVKWAPLKNLAFHGYLSQGHALVASENVDLTGYNGEALGFKLFRPEQTSVELLTTLTF